MYFNVRKISNTQVNMRSDIQKFICRHFKLYFDEMSLLFHMTYNGCRHFYSEDTGTHKHRRKPRTLPVCTILSRVLSVK